MRQELNVIKIGGNILDDPEQLSAFLAAFAALPGNAVLVHGGGKIATAIGTRLGIEARYHDGRRITDAATLELVTMVYGGLVNKQLVARLQAIGVNAIGLSGADGNLVRAERRPVKEIDYGYVGDMPPGGVSVETLRLLIHGGLTPVVAPLSHDGTGGMLNTNADTIAQEIAGAAARDWEVRLVYCFEKRGVLRDANDDDSVISSITSRDFAALLAQKIIHAGMIPKLRNALDAIDRGVRRVVIGSAAELPGLVAGNKGTQIQ